MRSKDNYTSTENSPTKNQNSFWNFLTILIRHQILLKNLKKKPLRTEHLVIAFQIFTDSDQEIVWHKL